MTMWIRNVELSIGQFFKALKPATTSADVLY